MEFALEAVAEDGAAKLRSTITRYKQSQSTYAGFIPTGQKKMLGLSAYRKWIKNLTTALQEANPSAQIDVNGPLAQQRRRVDLMILVTILIAAVLLAPPTSCIG